MHIFMEGRGNSKVLKNKGSDYLNFIISTAKEKPCLDENGEDFFAAQSSEVLDAISVYDNHLRDIAEIINKEIGRKLDTTKKRQIGLCALFL
jgi:hypothetical protein